MEDWKDGRLDEKAQSMFLYPTGHPLIKASIAAIDIGGLRSLAAAEPDEDPNIGLGSRPKVLSLPVEKGLSEF
jgi:hypothetical protein